MTTPVPWSDNTEFPNALTSAAITLVGLQSGGNVKVPPNALARAIQDAIALSVAFNFAGNITANNLSGVNTGDQVGALLAANNLSDVASAVASLDHIRKTGADIIASATTNIGAASGESINLTGTATITAFDVAAAGIRRTTRVVNAGLTFTHNGVTLQCITGANIVAAGGDQCEFLSLSSGNWRMLWYTRADGTPLVGGGGGGLTNVIRAASATVASNTRNRITANSVALTTPASPADFDIIQVLIESGALSSDSVIANSGQTVNGLSTWNLTITPCFVELCYDLAATNWFVTSARFGTL